MDVDENTAVDFDAQLERMRHRVTITIKKVPNAFLLFFIILSWQREDLDRQYHYILCKKNPPVFLNKSFQVGSRAGGRVLFS